MLAHVRAGTLVHHASQTAFSILLRETIADHSRPQGAYITQCNTDGQPQFCIAVDKSEMPSVAIFRVNINMFTVRLGVTTSLLLILSVLLRATIAVPYNIHPWDKNGDLLIDGVQCPHANQCSWYRRGVHGVSTRVSNNTTLDLMAQDSEYAEYYRLLDDQYQSVVEYALVVPNGNAGKLY